MSKVIFYHASPRRFRNGDVLVGGHKGGAGTAHSNVCLTTSPVPHGTVAAKAIAENWIVYEVRPLYPCRYVEGNGEVQTRAAVVVRTVGTAAAFAKKTGKGYSWVRPTPMRGVKVTKNFHLDY